MAKTDLTQFTQEMDRLIGRVPIVHRDIQAKLVGIAIDELVFTSPVLTGAYRASHAVGVGESADISRLVYDSPSHPEPDREVKLGEQMEPPQGNAAEAAYRGEAPFQNAILFNDRFYADKVEYGWSTRAGYGTYHAAEQIVEAVAAGVALGMSW